MSKRSWSALTASVASIGLGIMAISWWNGSRLPSADFQNLIYGSILLLVLVGGIAVWPDIRRLFRRQGGILELLTSAMWLTAVIVCVRVALILLGAVALGRG